MRSDADLPLVSSTTAGSLFLQTQGLAADPSRAVRPALVRREIEKLGFVQIDSINIVERAHQHILMTRLDGYRPPMLTKLAERDRSVFEHWTHDAALIPIASYPHWRHRFRRLPAGGPPPGSRWARRMGDDPKALVRQILARIEREGALTSVDFEHDRERGRGKWWDWKPQKVALEYLWRAGKLAIAGRRHFHKQYDLTQRVIPEAQRLARTRPAESVDWACLQALDRLVFASPTELARFFEAVSIDAAKAWCAGAERRGEIVAVRVEDASGGLPSRKFASSEWRRKAARLPAFPDRMRLLSPFDPVLRDRARTRLLFGFDYRFEAFVPAAKRQYGYYVLPVLHRNRLVARVDAKLHRDQGLLSVRGPWWEPEIRATREQRMALEAAVERFAEQIGADDWRVNAP